MVAISLRETDAKSFVSRSETATFRPPHSKGQIVNADGAGDSTPKHALPISGGGSVPVFDCRAFVTPPDEHGTVRARCGNLAGVAAEGPSEREALLRLVAQFKDVVRKCQEAGEPVPWVEPCPEPDANERPRWIPVHL